MSDLLPLVVALLGTRGAVEALEEIQRLKKESEMARAVEVIRGPPRPNLDNDNNNEQQMQQDGNHITNGHQQAADVVLVYSSGQFQEGRYGDNPEMWLVDLEQKNTCRLADLKSCRLCVGGGISVVCLDDAWSDFEGFLEGADEYDENAIAVSFRFDPFSVHLGLVVYGWPREEWEAIVSIGNEEDFMSMDPAEVIDYLVETVAANHPNATVEFLSVFFLASTVHGALQRLLPAGRKQELDAGRDELQALCNLREIVEGTMRARGNHNSHALFTPQVNTVVDLLESLRIRSIAANHEMITFVIAQYEELGESRVSEILRNSRMEMTRRETLAEA